MPKKVPPARLEASAYINSRGGEKVYRVSTRLLDNGASFSTTHPLGLHRNLSILLAFPKGVVAVPAGGILDGLLPGLGPLQGVAGLPPGWLGLIVLWGYYLVVWSLCGRNPVRLPFVARAEPPAGHSAAALRYVYRMGYDSTCLAAGVLELAERGF